MNIKISSSSIFALFPILPFITHRTFNPSSLKVQPFSASCHQLRSPVLRQPEYKPATIPPPLEKPKTISVNVADNNTIPDVLRLFDVLELAVTPDIYGVFVAECTRKGDGEQAAEVYNHMKRNSRMVKWLKGSSGLLLFNRILMMFVICGKLDFARKVFEEMPQRNCVSLSVLIAALVNNELFEECLELFVEMYECCVYRGSYKALRVVVTCVLEACVYVNNVDLGMMVHGWLVKMGFGEELFVGIAFVDFYGKCKCLWEANRVFFQQIQMDGCCDTDLWTCAIVNNSREGNFNGVLRIFMKMGQAGVTMNHHTVSTVLKACGKVNDESLGKQVHALAVKSGLESYVLVMCGLVNMYGRCKLLSEARRAFDMIDYGSRSSACWNAMVTVLIENGMWIDALKMLYQMKAAGFQPKQSIVNAVRMVCGSAKSGGDISFHDSPEPG